MIQTIIVAGGKGERMKSAVPKQFLLLKGLPILMHTINIFAPFSDKIILVLPKEQKEYWEQLIKIHNFKTPHILVEGGKERFYSVYNALKEVENKGIVLVHDGVRPLVNSTTIKKAIQSAENKGSGIPCMPITESLRYDDQQQNYAVNRNLYKSIQTPQAFTAEQLKKAYEQNFKDTFTDDASVFESAGYPIFLTEGNRSNIKITEQEDLVWAEYFLNHNQL